MPKPPPRRRVALAVDEQEPTSGHSTFTQYIDHSNPDLGTFEQFYYWGSEFWGGPGSPVILMTPGESAAEGYDSYLENTTITGHFAEAINAAVVVVEHRYWGQSVPVPDLSTENLKYLTVNQSLADFERFAREVKLPFDKEQTSIATKAPWVMSGGSYSGALSAYMANVKPGTFWVYTSTSGPVETIYDFYGYFDPIREHMPKNCSADVQKVIGHVDAVLTNGTEEEQHSLMSDFNAIGIEHLDDFASAFSSPIYQWQSNQYYGGYSAPFYEFCDAIEGVGSGSYNSSLPGPEGVGFKDAYNNFAEYMKKYYFYNGTCGDSTYDCFDTYNPNSSTYTDISASNDFRQWEWILCNEPFAFWQDGAPEGHPSVISRLVSAEYQQRQCALYFPEAKDGFSFRSEEGYTVDNTNAYFGGWDVYDTKRLLHVTGSADPWREACVSSTERPGGPRSSSNRIPIFEIDGGFHCTDMLMENAVNENVKKAIDEETAQVVEWIKQWPGARKSLSSSKPSSASATKPATKSSSAKTLSSHFSSTAGKPSSASPSTLTSKSFLPSSVKSIASFSTSSVSGSASASSLVPSVAAPSTTGAGSGVSSSASGPSVTTTVVSSFTTFCPSSTELTFNGHTYTATGSTTLTITDCPCTLTQSGKPTAAPTASSAVSKPQGQASSVTTSEHDSVSTVVVSAFTTYCPGSTEFTFNGKTYTATESTTMTITDCPCTLTTGSSPSAGPVGTPGTVSSEASSTSAISPGLPSSSGSPSLAPTGLPVEPNQSAPAVANGISRLVPAVSAVVAGMVATLLL